MKIYFSMLSIRHFKIISKIKFLIKIQQCKNNWSQTLYNTFSFMSCWKYFFIKINFFNGKYKNDFNFLQESSINELFSNNWKYTVFQELFFNKDDEIYAKKCNFIEEMQIKYNCFSL